MVDYFRKSDLAIAYAKAMRPKMQVIARPVFLNGKITTTDPATKLSLGRLYHLF